MNLRRLASRRALAVLGLLAVLAVVALGGAIKDGQAASANPVSWTFTVLNDSGNTPVAPTPGGNIGYELTGAADQGKTANHLILTESIGPAGKVVYIGSTGNPGLSCSGLNTTTLSCSLTQLKAGGTFDVVVLFKTDSAATPGSTVSNTVVAASIRRLRTARTTVRRTRSGRPPRSTARTPGSATGRSHSRLACRAMH